VDRCASVAAGSVAAIIGVGTVSGGFIVAMIVAGASGATSASGAFADGLMDGLVRICWHCGFAARGPVMAAGIAIAALMLAGCGSATSPVASRVPEASGASMTPVTSGAPEAPASVTSVAGDVESVAETYSRVEPSAEPVAASESRRVNRAAEAAERARQAAELQRQRQDELTRQREEQQLAEEERREQVERAERQQQEQRQQAAERETRLARIAELEARIAELRAEIAAGDALSETMREAVLASEQLLALLTEEQATYQESNLDSEGNLIEPPATEEIEELETRRGALLEKVTSC